MKSIIKKVCKTVAYTALLTLIALNLMAIRPIYYAMKDISSLIQKLRASTNAFEMHHTRQIDKLWEELEKNYKNDIAFNKLFSEFLDMNTRHFDNLKKDYDNIQESLDDYQPIDLPQNKQLLNANVTMHNISTGSQGSGTIIKIKNKIYILSCAHLLSQVGDNIMLAKWKDTAYPLDLIKVDFGTDLSLFALDIANPPAYLELSDVYPEVGSQIQIVGNPSGWEDILTQGSIAKKDGFGYLITGLIYFGNSGGALVYKNKIVGVVVELRVQYNAPVFVNYGYCVGINTIRTFLRETGIQ